MNLYHYFESGNDPFLTLSDLSHEESIRTQDSLKENGNVYQRRDYDGNYMYFRRIVEKNVRSAFIKKGGNPIRLTPIYFMLGESHTTNNTSYKQWFKNVSFIEIPINEVIIDSVSFTYGDSFIENHPEHRNQAKYHETVLTYYEILEKIKNCGWPQDSVKEDSPFWVPHYIEAQVWCDEMLNRYRHHICKDIS